VNNKCDLNNFFELREKDPESFQIINFLIVVNNAFHKILKKTIKEVGSNKASEIIKNSDLTDDEKTLLKHSVSINKEAFSKRSFNIDLNMN